MRALVQRVSEASVTVDGSIIGQITTGLLVFLAIRYDDTEARAAQLASKIVQLRIFPDSQHKMNLSVMDIAGELLIVSQFTLYAETGKGNRPSYSQAARPEAAQQLYRYFIQICRDRGLSVAAGRFQAHMQVRLTNDGPVTVMCYAET
ncbi:MAG TPA: D-aminoacyl-tRNA deacylase [Bryobacteraceae bacterium]|jgi:D-tyrosyl-tRNA(Tyr) deacylase